MTLVVLLLMFLFSLSFVGCDIQKEASKNKTDTNLKGSEETRRFRAGDTVGYKPQLRPRYKDTTIYTYNRQGTTLETIYDKNGNISDINCMASKIEEQTKRIFELEQQTKDKEKQKTENFDSSFILYIVGGVVFLGMIFMLFLFIYVSKNTKAVTQMLTAIKDKV